MKLRSVIKLLALLFVPFAVLLGGSAVMIWTIDDADNAVSYAAHAVFTSAKFALVSLLGLWLVVSQSRWQVRIALVLIGTALLQGFVPWGFLGGEIIGGLGSLPCIWSSIATSLMGCVLLRFFRIGVKLVSAGGEPEHLWTAPTTPRFSVLDLMLWVGATAAWFGSPPKLRFWVASHGLLSVTGEWFIYGVGYYWIETTYPFHFIASLLLTGALSALGAFVALWSVFGTTRLSTRLIGLFVVTPLGSWFVTGLSDWYMLGESYWLVDLEFVVVISLQAFFTAVALWMFRFMGYRLLVLHHLTAPTGSVSQGPLLPPHAAA